MKVIIIPPRGRCPMWQINLSEGAGVYERRRFRSPRTALIEVARHLADGLEPAFASAFDELVIAAYSQSLGLDAA